MRLEFDAKTSRLDQLMRTADAKRVGRKHNHKPSSRVTERCKASAKRHCQIEAKKAKAFRQKVAAYWRGELGSYPA